MHADAQPGPPAEPATELHATEATTSASPATSSTAGATEGSAVTKAATDALRHSNGSFELVLAALVLGFIGYLIDRRLGTMPIFLLVFTIAGFVGAALSLYYRFRYQIATIQSETEALRAQERSMLDDRKGARS